MTSFIHRPARKQKSVIDSYHNGAKPDLDSNPGLRKQLKNADKDAPKSKQTSSFWKRFGHSVWLTLMLALGMYMGQHFFS